MNTRRISSVDVLRGMAIFIMLLVDALPDFQNAYPLLLHSSWEGLTIADTAFPSFMFIMGTSIVLSMNNKKCNSDWWRKVIRRGVVLILLGLLYNNVPYAIALIFMDGYSWGQFYDSVITYGRPCGVLQRLGITYVICSGIMALLQEKYKYIQAKCGIDMNIIYEGISKRLMCNNILLLSSISLLILLCTSVTYRIYNLADPFSSDDNISIYFDTLFLGTTHTYYGMNYDPEGIFTTINSVATVLLGGVAGKILLGDSNSKDKVKQLLQIAVILLAAGVLWSMVDIVSKPMWSSPYVLIMAGIDSFVLAILVRYIDSATRVTVFTRFCHPFRSMGCNAILLYMMSGVLLSLLWTLTEDNIPLYSWLWYNSVYDSSNVAYSCFLYAARYAVMMWCIAELLYMKRIFVKV